MAVRNSAPRADPVSLILDALKKSENARQQQAGPALATVPGSSAQRRRSPWPWILGGVLVANAVLLALVLTRGGGDRTSSAPPPDAGVRPAVTSAPAPAERAPVNQPAEPPTEASGPATAEADPEAGQPGPPRDAPVMLARERRIQSLDSMVGRQIAPPPATAPSPEDAGRRGSVVYEGEPPAGTGERETRPGRVIYEGESDAGQPEPASTPPAPAPAPTGNRLPSFQDLQLRGELSLAPMHVDIHVYSDNPSERFVFINMRKYNEGDKTSEGPVVERIDKTGAILSHQGRRFLLPRD